jgi:protein-disulfide isomerase
MKNKLFKYCIATVIIAGISGCAQSPTLGEEVAALKQDQAKMQKDLEEIKTLIAKKTPAQPKPFQPSALNINGAPFHGKADAPVTLVEFTDYQCPFCKRHATSTVPQILKEYVETGKLKYVLRDFPLKQIHSHAFKLAQATLCANEQGKAWEMHDRIFGAEKTPDPSELSKDVKAVGIDAKAFKACLDSDKYAGMIDASIAEGSSLGIRGTPGFFLGKTDLNDHGKIQATEMLVGAQPFAAFKQAIDKILNEEKQPQQGR